HSRHTLHFYPPLRTTRRALSRLASLELEKSDTPARASRSGTRWPKEAVMRGNAPCDHLRRGAITVGRVSGLMSIASPPEGFRGPVKRSITIAGHETSITLEPIFWRALESAAAALSLPLNALVAQIDARRIEATNPPNLASALRTWAMADAQRSRIENHSQ